MIYAKTVFRILIVSMNKPITISSHSTSIYNVLQVKTTKCCESSEFTQECGNFGIKVTLSSLYNCKV